MKLPRFKKLRVDKRTKKHFGFYKAGKTQYFRVWKWGFFWE